MRERVDVVDALMRSREPATMDAAFWALKGSDAAAPSISRASWQCRYFM
jgi:hypothetical protein